MKYKPTHTYEMIPMSNNPPLPAATQSIVQADIKSKAERLRETKKLLEEKILTQQEYETEKQKILNEPQ